MKNGTNNTDTNQRSETMKTPKTYRLIESGRTLKVELMTPEMAARHNASIVEWGRKCRWIEAPKGYEYR